MAQPYAPKPPSWYSATTAYKPPTDQSSFLWIANSLIPYLSAPDQSSVATFLGTQDMNAPHPYIGKDVAARPTERASSETRQEFLSSKRAAQALAEMDRLRTAGGLTEDQMGTGYRFLRQAINILQRLGINPDTGEQGTTRAEYEQIQSELEALNSQAASNRSLAPFAELAQRFLNPSTIGSLMPATKLGERTIYGQASEKLFT